MALDEKKLQAALPRLEKEENIWLTTVRADGRPHLVPLWFVWLDGKVWICTPRDSQKVKNIRKNPHVALSLEDGLNPLILEGKAALRHDAPWPDKLGPRFEKKYGWDFRTDDTAEYVLVEIVPVRVISWTTPR